MGRYSSSIVDRALSRARYKCEACGKHWDDLDDGSGGVFLFAHSSTTFHLIWIKSKKMYKSTCVPEGHERVKGRFFKPENVLVYKYMNKREDDAFCLCKKCHVKVHEIAEKLSVAHLGGNKDRKNAVPSILEWVSVMYVLKKTKWTPFK